VIEKRNGEMCLARRRRETAGGGEVCHKEAGWKHMTELRPAGSSISHVC
jgi:hypothetical protein